VYVDEAEARCISFLPRVRGPLAEHDVRGALALLQARRSSFDTARSDIAGSIASLEELGAYADLAVALHRAAQIEILTGQPAAGEPQMQRALAAAANARDDGLRAALAASFAHILIGDDERLDEALALADVAEAHARDITTNVGWRLARARVMVRRGRGALAERLAREAVSLAEQTDSTDLRATALLDAADVRRQAGRPAEAEPFEKRALRLFERRGATAQAAMVPGFSTTPAPEPDPVSEAPTTADDPTPQPVDAPPAAASDGIATPVADEMPLPSSENEPTAPIETTAQEPTEPLAQPVDEPAAADQPAPQSDTFFANGSAGHSPDERSAEDESKHRWFNR
jgi:tetratricopeptide (TPR) repeat protein